MNNATIETEGFSSTTSPAEDMKKLEQLRKFSPDIYWYLSFRCNLACKHCSVESSPYVDTTSDLTTQECERVISELKSLNVRQVFMTGGEVLIRKDAVDIMEMAIEAGLRVGLETNATVFPPHFLEKAAQWQKKGMFQISVSLDGGTEEAHDFLRGPRAYERTLRNMRKLPEADLKFSAQIVCNRRNFHTIPDLYQLARELYPAFYSVQLGFLYPLGRGGELVNSLELGREELAKVFDLATKEWEGYDGLSFVKLPPAAVPPKYINRIFSHPRVKLWFTCQFPLLGILPNGDVTICALSRENEDLYFGNIRKLELKEIWERSQMETLRQQYLNADHLGGICGDCIWKKKCLGSCRAWAYEIGGNFESPSPLCQQLADKGSFPKMYRISEQMDLAGQSMPEGKIHRGPIFKDKQVQELTK